MVDGIWYVHTAKHVYDGTTYVTDIDLRPPSKSKNKKNGNEVAHKIAVVGKSRGKGKGFQRSNIRLVDVGRTLEKTTTQK